MIGVGILIGSFVLESISLAVAVKGINADRGDTPLMEFMTHGDDPTGVGVLLEDLAAVGGVLIALIGVGLTQLLHNPLPDIIATLLIGVLLGFLAVFLAKTNGRLLIGASVTPAEQEKIKRALEADEIVEKVEDLKTEILGQGRIRVKCEVDLWEKLVATRMLEPLRADAQRISNGEEPMKVLVDVVGRAVRLTGAEIQRLEGVIEKVSPNAKHIDLELL